MPHREARRRAAYGAALGALAAALPMAWLWGFTVDDAFIPARVAWNLARGVGHRFNPGGPLVDAVTPLGWAYLLAPFARSGPLEAMYFAKWFGACAWFGAAAWLGKEIFAAGGARSAVVFLPLALCLPIGAWCVSGMETGIVVALSTAALARSRWAPLAAGLAAAWRPELVAWSVSLALGRALAARSGRKDVLVAVAQALGPAVAVALVRLVVFGTPAPLAAAAKPSDLSHGIAYALGALQWTGAPFLVLAPWALRKIDGESRALLAAAGVHTVAIVLVGGDWMAFFRLFVPVLPGLFLVGARVAAVSAPWATAVRLGAAVFFSAFLLVDKGDAARGVLEQRLRLVTEARPLLARCRRVATVDVGWVSVASPAEVTDLAGVTEPSIGRLPGGHTSKRIPETLLRSRKVDSLVLLAASSPAESVWETRWSRTVEARVAREARELGFVLEGSLELQGTPQHYVVLRLRNDP